MQGRNSKGGSRGLRDDRKVIEMFTMTAIQNYGCWCAFDGLLPIKGTPQDPADEYCHKWHASYDCITHDHGVNCSYEVPYNDVLVTLPSPFDNQLDYFEVCQTANSEDACAAHACTIDADFMRSIFNYLSSNSLNAGIWV